MASATYGAKIMKDLGLIPAGYKIMVVGSVQEGCLSLTGVRKTKRFQTVKVQWQNEQFQTRLKTFTGWTAEIIQHEIDHCEGILI